MKLCWILQGWAMLLDDLHSAQRYSGNYWSLICGHNQCWLVDTQETLAALDRLDLDNDKPSDEEIARKFGFEEEYHEGRVTWWQKSKPKIWSIFDEPYSSSPAKVNRFLVTFTNWKFTIVETQSLIYQRKCIHSLLKQGSYWINFIQLHLPTIQVFKIEILVQPCLIQDISELN